MNLFLNELLLNNNYCVIMFSLTYYYIMFPWPMGMVVASLSRESTIPHSLQESGLDSGGQARPLVTVVCGLNNR